MKLAYSDTKSDATVNIEREGHYENRAIWLVISGDWNQCTTSIASKLKMNHNSRTL